MHQAFTNFNHRSATMIRVMSDVLALISFIAAIICGICFVIYIGYDHSELENLYLLRAMRGVQWVFVTNVTFNLIFNFRNTLRKTRPIKWSVDIAILLSAIPYVIPRPAHPWLPALESLIYGNAFLFAVIGAYSMVTFCYGIVRIIGKRTNPSLMLSGSFLIFIIIGSFMLMLPKCTIGGISYVNALFISTSAVCITGLTPIDISVYLTPMGFVVLSILIQIGGIGVMTFTNFFAIFFSGNTSIYSQLMLKDVIYSKSMSALIPTLLYILGFTITIEVIGAIFIFISIHGTLAMTIEDEIKFSLFHSLSSFCNAGFSSLPGGMSNRQLLTGNISIYWITSALIVAGSIGFPILVNFKDALMFHFRRILTHLHHKPAGNKQVHLYNMNTKIVLITFSALLVGGAALFYLLENDNTMAGMTTMEKITQSVFNSVTPRSAGFVSIDPSSFLNATLIMVLFLMWVGGASQSTGGGIKVNTLAAIVLNLRAIITGRHKVTAFKRTIAVGSIRRANAVVAISILSYLSYSMVMVYLNPDIPAKKILFETCSALFTVGSSLGITDQLSDASKVILCTAMFLGRVGIISLLTGIAGRRKDHNVEYPSDNIIIS